MKWAEGGGDTMRKFICKVIRGGRGHCIIERFIGEKRGSRMGVGYLEL